ncbi:MAG: hypothetical protein FJ090_10705 [Deltaproteobacteria bacterium]|nr:hypothetical protein [Deltaproteobacteria bacterium]
MHLSGTLRREGTRWTLRDGASGRTYDLEGADFPPRMDGLAARITGTLADSFGAGLGSELPVVQVQRWSAA